MTQKLRNVPPLLEGLLVDGIDVSCDAVVVVCELPDEFLLCVCHEGHASQEEEGEDEGGKGAAVHFRALLVRCRLGF